MSWEWLTVADASFGPRLREAMSAYGPLCVGIDPHEALLDAWGLTQDVSGLARFAEACVTAFAGRVACVKPQSAFFERFGSGGVAVLEQALATLRAAGTLTVLDVKRGDIGSTMAAYASAYLSDASPVRADAITVSPFLGYESLRPALDLAATTGRGVFVLALTSNPEGPSVQHAVHAGQSVARTIVDGVARDNEQARDRGEWGSIGMVVGATIGDAPTCLGIDLAAANAPLLAPGVGAQGGTAADLRRVFGAALPNVLASASREVLGAGPSVASLVARAEGLAESLARTLVAAD